jgi:hypothetical protein
MDFSDDISLSNSNTTGGFLRPTFRDAEFSIDKFSEKFFILPQVISGVIESEKYHGLMDKIALAFHKRFTFIENNSNLSYKDKLLILYFIKCKPLFIYFFHLFDKVSTLF